MLQAWIVIYPSSTFYIVSTIVFHKYVGSIHGVKNFMSHIYMLVPTNANMKLANGNMVHAQVIGIILCHFSNYDIIYLAVPVYWCSYHPYNNIKLCALHIMLVFQRLRLNLLNIVFFGPSRFFLAVTLPYSKQFLLSSSWVCQSQTSKKHIYCGSNCLWTLWAESISTYPSTLCHISVYRRNTANKGLMKILPMNLPNL